MKGIRIMGWILATAWWALGTWSLLLSVKALSDAGSARSAGDMLDQIASYHDSVYQWQREEYQRVSATLSHAGAEETKLAEARWLALECLGAATVGFLCAATAGKASRHASS